MVETAVAMVALDQVEPSHGVSVGARDGSTLSRIELGVTQFRQRGSGESPIAAQGPEACA
jgi:hypothetical protein